MQTSIKVQPLLALPEIFQEVPITFQNLNDIIVMLYNSTSQQTHMYHTHALVAMDQNLKATCTQ